MSNYRTNRHRNSNLNNDDSTPEHLLKKREFLVCKTLKLKDENNEARELLKQVLLVCRAKSSVPLSEWKNLKRYIELFVTE